MKTSLAREIENLLRKLRRKKKNVAERSEIKILRFLNETKRLSAIIKCVLTRCENSSDEVLGNSIHEAD